MYISFSRFRLQRKEAKKERRRETQIDRSSHQSIIPPRFNLTPIFARFTKSQPQRTPLFSSSSSIIHSPNISLLLPPRFTGRFSSYFPLSFASMYVYVCSHPTTHAGGRCAHEWMMRGCCFCCVDL